MRHTGMRWLYERRVALADRGWSLLLVPLLLGGLLLITDPIGRVDLWAFAGEPLLGLLGGLLAARLIVHDGALAFVLMRRPLRRLWLERFALLMGELALLAPELRLLRAVLPPEPRAYWAYQPWTGLVAAWFFAAASSLFAVGLGQALAGEVWTVFWTLPSLLLLFPVESVRETGLGPFFPFPVWFIYRRLAQLPFLRPVFVPADIIPPHLVALSALSLGLMLAHGYALERFRRRGL